MTALVLPLAARTWTSSDGTKTFQGDLKSYDSATGKVTVMLTSGKQLTFPKDKLSADDIKFLEEQSAAAAKPDPSEALAAQKVGAQVLKAKLQRLEGKRFKKAELDYAPEYYILYYSASW